MRCHSTSRRDYVTARIAVRILKRRIREFRRRLLAEYDPIAYYSTLYDIALTSAQLDGFCVQVLEWKTQLKHHA